MVFNLKQQKHKPWENMERVLAVGLTAVAPEEKTKGSTFSALVRKAATKLKPVPMERVSKATVEVIVSPSMELKC
jgi:hypothetical protein